jgi:hypothetical protein
VGEAPQVLKTLEIPLKLGRLGKPKRPVSQSPALLLGAAQFCLPHTFLLFGKNCCLAEELGKLALSSKKQQVIICPKQTNSQTAGLMVSPKLESQEVHVWVEDVGT